MNAMTMTAEPRQAISGNTYPVKEQLKALGARWDGAAKVWMIEASKADEARAIVTSAGPKKAFRSGDGGGYRPGRRCYCAECGEPYRRGQTCWETGGMCTPEWE